MKTPIYTRVENTANVPRYMRVGNQCLYIEPNASITVDFDIWSRCDRGQQEALCAMPDIKLFIGLRTQQDPAWVEFLLALSDTAEFATAAAMPEVLEVELTPSMPLDIHEDIQPAVDKASVEDSDGVQVEESTTLFEESEEEDVMPENPSTAEIASEADLEMVRNAFDVAVAAHNWTEAHAALVAAFGDKVTFKPRAIMSTRAFDDIVKKYNLTM